MTSIPATADVADAYPNASVADLPFIDYGGVLRFAGEVETVRCFEDNTLVDRVLQSPGEGRVLVVDGGASIRVALMGDRLGALAVANGWSGVVIEGFVRDTALLRAMAIGVKALGSTPRRSNKRGQGQIGSTVRIGRIDVRAGWWMYADEDGVVAIPEPAELG